MTDGTRSQSSVGYLPGVSCVQRRRWTSSVALRMRRSTYVDRRRAAGRHSCRYSCGDNLLTHTYTLLLLLLHIQWSNHHRKLQARTFLSGVKFLTSIPLYIFPLFLPWLFPAMNWLPKIHLGTLESGQQCKLHHQACPRQISGQKCTFTE